MQNRRLGSFEEWGPIAALAVFSALGTEYKEASCLTWFDEADDRDLFTKVDLTYDSAVGTIEVANGVKSEGDLVIAGTDAYAYVPSPWWKTDYFEIRREDPAQNKRYFYQLDGEGIRHEIAAFSRAVSKPSTPSAISTEMTIALAKLMGEYRSGSMRTAIVRS